MLKAAQRNTVLPSLFLDAIIITYAERIGMLAP